MLVFELTGSLDSLLSASIVSMAAYIIADLLNVDPFYEYLLTKLMCGTGEDARASLAATEKIIHEHKGDIKIKSTYGVGTEFKILLPLSSIFS